VPSARKLHKAVQRTGARLPNRSAVAANARCDYCRRVLRADRIVPGPGGLQFDSVKCRQGYVSAAPVKALQNGLRVARSRLKGGTIARAGALYRSLGGRQWSLVERLLRAVL
jgi:hypothetical protein